MKQKELDQKSIQIIAIINVKAKTSKKVEFEQSHNNFRI